MRKLNVFLAIVTVTVMVVLVTAGCQERFRYPCMDQKNWNSAQCKRPQCAILQECPDQLLKPEDMKGEGQ